MPEVVGDAALLVDPTDEEDLAGKIEYIIDNPSVSRGLSIKGLRQAKKFSWNKSAEVLLNVYNKL
jgi:glycosyltransferase involved in cell wall biosynthesis